MSGSALPDIERDIERDLESDAGSNTPDRSDVADPTVAMRFRDHVAHRTPMPRPGGGRTSERLSALRRASLDDPSLGRLIEAHEDALAILGEAGRFPGRGRLLAVWASSGGAQVTIGGDHSGSHHIDGTQSFCGGASIVDDALVVVGSGDRTQLVLVPMSAPGVTIIEDSWPSNTFAAAGIRTVSFDHVHVDTEQLIGPPNFYSDRPGFWQGAVGVAACWAGMIDALIAHRGPPSRIDEIFRLRDGRIVAAKFAVDAALDAAAAWIDRYPDASAAAVALAARHAVAEAGHGILRDVIDEAGPRRMAFDPDFDTRCRSLQLALRQCHGDRDLVALSDASDVSAESR
jgi:hypothetical protein